MNCGTAYTKYCLELIMNKFINNFKGYTNEMYNWFKSARVFKTNLLS